MLAKSLARLSSGSKITSPEDDAAGLAVSMRFDAQINRLTATKANVTNAISFNQTQDGFMSKVSKSLDRMSELAILSQDVTKSDADRGLYQKEFLALGEYIDDLGTKDFNGVSLFSGSALAVTIDSDGNTFDMTGVDLAATEYSTATGGDISTTTGAATALTDVKAAIDQLAEDRAPRGAISPDTTGEQLSVLARTSAPPACRIKDTVWLKKRSVRCYSILGAGTASVGRIRRNRPSSLLSKQLRRAKPKQLGPAPASSESF
jgi:flagellin